MGNKSVIFVWHLTCCIAIFQMVNAQQDRNITADIQTKIDNYIRDTYLASANATNMVVAIVRNNGEMLYTAGFGFADQERNISMSNDTQISIGSVTKSFTSVLIVKTLHEKFPELGETVLDTPIRKLIPSYNFTLNDRFRSEFATFRDLLSHRVCLQKQDLQLLAEGVDTSAEVAYRQRYAEEKCGLRTGYEYNNAIYVLAGDVIAAIGNRSYDEMATELLAEIGMTKSSLVKRSDDFSNMPFRAMPYYIKENVSYPMNPELVKRVVPDNAAGGLFLTANDMAKYMMFHLNYGKIGDRQVVPVVAMTWLSKVAIHIPSSSPAKMTDADYVFNTYGYGLGLILASQDGYYYNLHNGYLPPYGSQMSLYPGLKLGIFTASNQGLFSVISPQSLHVFLMETARGSTDANEKTQKIVDIFKRVWAYLQSVNGNKQGAIDKFLEETAKGEQADVSEILGLYGSPTGGDLILKEKFNEDTNSTGIYLSYGKWVKAWVEGLGGTVYKLIWDSDIVQDGYASGTTTYLEFITIKNGTLTFYWDLSGTLQPWVKFQYGASLDMLPTVPWDAGSCGPGTNTKNSTGSDEL